MSKTKKKQSPPHVYTDAQTKWLRDNKDLGGVALTKAFNKEFKMNQSKTAIVKRRRRILGLYNPGAKSAASKQATQQNSKPSMQMNSTDIITKFYADMKRLGFRVIVEIERD